MNIFIETLKNNQPYFEDFTTRSTHNSNGIEGNTLSFAETYAILFNDNSLKITAEPREIYEAINHKYALDYLFKHVNEELSETFILSIAKIINKNINEIGGYRSTQVFIRGAEHIPPAPNMIKQQMMYFLDNYHNTSFTDVFEKVAGAHIAFERIHPFSDGNGRTGRILINHELIRSGYAPAVITKNNRADYLEMLAAQNVSGLSKLISTASSDESVRMKQFIQIEQQVQTEIPRCQMNTDEIER